MLSKMLVSKYLCIWGLCIVNWQCQICGFLLKKEKLLSEAIEIFSHRNDVLWCPLLFFPFAGKRRNLIFVIVIISLFKLLLPKWKMRFLGWPKWSYHKRYTICKWGQPVGDKTFAFVTQWASSSQSRVLSVLAALFNSMRYSAKQQN